MKFAGLRTALGRWLAIALAIPMCWIASSASAITYFNGPDGFGIDPRFAGPADFRILSADDWRPAGSKKLNEGDFDIVLKSKQQIIEKDGFSKVKVKWKIKNKTGDTLDRALLFFSEIGPPPDFPDYEGRTVDLESRGKQDFSVIAFTNDEGEEFRFFGWELEDFAPGEKGRLTRKFKYTIEGDLVNRRTPALGVAASFNMVPEPSTTMLLVTTTVALAVARRRSSQVR